jgi:hypothetical protein
MHDDLNQHLIRATNSLSWLSETITEQEKLITVMRAEHRATKCAERLLSSFKSAQAALLAYKNELDSRVRNQEDSTSGPTEKVHGSELQQLEKHDVTRGKGNRSSPPSVVPITYL